MIDENSGLNGRFIHLFEFALQNNRNKWTHCLTSEKMDYSRTFGAQNPRVRATSAQSHNQGGDQVRQYVQFQQQQYQQQVLGNKPIGSRVFQPQSIQQRQQQQQAQQRQQKQQQRYELEQQRVPNALKMSRTFKRSTTSPIASLRQTPAAHGRKFGESRNHSSYSQDDYSSQDDFSYTWETPSSFQRFQNDFSQPWEQQGQQQPSYDTYEHTQALEIQGMDTFESNDRSQEIQVSKLPKQQEALLTEVLESPAIAGEQQQDVQTIAESKQLICDGDTCRWEPSYEPQDPVPMDVDE